MTHSRTYYNPGPTNLTTGSNQSHTTDLALSFESGSGSGRATSALVLVSAGGAAGAGTEARWPSVASAPPVHMPRRRVNGCIPSRSDVDQMVGSTHQLRLPPIDPPARPHLPPPSPDSRRRRPRGMREGSLPRACMKMLQSKRASRTYSRGSGVGRARLPLQRLTAPLQLSLTSSAPPSSSFPTSSSSPSSSSPSPSSLARINTCTSPTRNPKPYMPVSESGGSSIQVLVWRWVSLDAPVSVTAGSRAGVGR